MISKRVLILQISFQNSPFSLYKGVKNIYYKIFFINPVSSMKKLKEKTQQNFVFIERLSSISNEYPITDTGENVSRGQKLAFVSWKKKMLFRFTFSCYNISREARKYDPPFLTERAFWRHQLYPGMCQESSYEQGHLKMISCCCAVARALVSATQGGERQLMFLNAMCG